MQIGRSFGVAFSPDGKWLATLDESAVRILSAADGTKRTQFKVRNPSHVRFSPSGATVIVKTTSGQLSRHAADGVESQVIFPGEGEGPSPEFASEAQILDAGWDGTVALVDLFTRARTPISRFAGDMIEAIHHLADGSGWLLLHSPRATTDDQPPNPSYFSSWPADLLGGTPALISHGLRFIRASALHPSGETLAVANGAPPNELALIDARSPSIHQTHKIQPGGTGSALCWSNDGDKLAVVERDCVRVYDQRLTMLIEFPVPYASSVAFAPRTKLLAIGSWQKGEVVQL